MENINDNIVSLFPEKREKCKESKSLFSISAIVDIHSSKKIP